LVNWTLWFAADLQSECPPVVLDGAGGWEVDADCTTADGSREYFGHGEGSGILSAGWSPPWSGVWSEFGWYRNDIGSVEVTGVQDYQSDGDVLLSDLEWAGEERGGSYGFSSTEHRVSGFRGFVSGPSSWALEASVVVATGGDAISVVASGTGAWTPGCSLEFGSGELRMEVNGDAATLSFDGASNCDGETPYVTEGGARGSL
jgi:hypothetical protein